MRCDLPLGRLERMEMEVAPLLGFIVSLLVIRSLYEQAICPRCSGRGAHRDDCPAARR